MHGFRACTVVKMMLGRSLEGRKVIEKKNCASSVYVDDGNGESQMAT